MVEWLHRRLKESLMASCGDRPDQWFWRLPCTLLALRTILKPNVGASPANMVFGEGLALPGDLLGDPSSDPPTAHQRRQLFSNLRLEVARLMPTETSAHRQPHMWIPDSLSTATHVFIRRGGVQASLTTPYEGPFRVASRGPQNFKVHLPGRGVETVAISRLKPAHVSMECKEGVEPQDLDSEVPPSSPPPG